jgi:uncharacterized protein (DUF1499 family)
MFWIGMTAVLGLCFLAYVRLAPSPGARWHVAPEVEENKVLANGVHRRVALGIGGLGRLDRIAESDPRTHRLAGSVDQGMITYISRTRLVGFPVYTTVMQAGEELLIHARSRFGRRDFGTNAVRVDHWIDALTAY